MQSKVSMVMPCYNKKEYIGEMLQSIIDQVWNSIELILVNDGSTDGTREVIAEYEPRIRARGYEVVIVDQDNAGPCVAVKSGLQKISGEYVCVVDADDKLAPEYVSTMAEWLTEHTDCDYASCDFDLCSKKDNAIVFKPYVTHKWIPEDTYTPEFFLYNCYCKAVWAFLIRVEYFRKARILETFYTGTRGSYEPICLLPLSLHHGKLKHFDLPLYHYNNAAEGMSQANSFKTFCYYMDEYHRIVVIMLNSIDPQFLDQHRKQYLVDLSLYYTLKMKCFRSYSAAESQAETGQLLAELIAHINNWLAPFPKISADIGYKEGVYLTKAIDDIVIGTANEPVVPRGRVVGYGAKGQVAATLLPMLIGSHYEPAELWDQSASEDATELFGIPLSKPKFEELNKDDTLLIFPTSAEVVEEINKRLATCEIVQVIDSIELQKLAAYVMFPGISVIKR